MVVEVLGEPNWYSTFLVNKKAKVETVSIYTYYCKECESFEKSVTIAAAERGHLKCLEYAHSKGAPLPDRAVNPTAKADHLDCLKYLRENNARCTFTTYNTAGPKCKQYLKDMGWVYKSKKSNQIIQL
jgi:hypothetical protein